MRWSLPMYAALLIGCLMFLWIALGCESEDISFDDELVWRPDVVWTASSKETSRQVRLPARLDAKAGETVAFSTILYEDRGYYNSIMLRANHQYIKVYLDGELCSSFGYRQHMPFSEAPGNGWIIMRLPQDCQGRRLTIEVTGYYSKFSGALDSVYLGTKNALVFMVLRSSFPAIIFNFTVIIISLMLLLSSLFIKRLKMVSQIRCLSLFALVTGSWLLLESGGYQFFLGKPPIAANLIFILFSLVPVTCVRFLLTYQSFAGSRYMKAVYVASLANFLIIQLLQITRLCDYLQSMAGNHLIILLIIAGILAGLLRTLLKKERLKDKALYVASLVFAAFGCIDILRFYQESPVNNSVIFSQAGLFLFFFLLGGAAVKKGVSDHENGIRQEVLKHMAYTDYLTSLPNRNAFEQELERYRKARPKTGPLLVVADLNNLKRINDTYGHTKGDDAIVHMGRALSRCFGNDSRVYRIGGDEFCVISENLTEEAAEGLLTRFGQEMAREESKAGIPLSAAAGCCRENGEGMEEAFKKADSRMYTQKEIMKKKQEGTVRHD